MSLNVLYDEPGALEMSNGASMKRIREIAAQERPFAGIDELTNPEWLTQNADIGVHTHHEHISNAAVFKEVEHLLTIVANGVSWIDVNRVDLTRPRLGRVETIAAWIGSVAGTWAWVPEPARDFRFPFDSETSMRREGRQEFRSSIDGNDDGADVAALLDSWHFFRDIPGGWVGCLDDLE